ncbi:unnamed protein product [Tilletia laevis]|uniref:Uncharacterized protein n=2 Tax=Tilletia TaxID=13289 RepID=A0A177VEI1_9BASI|nr:hypothetical protein CF336_g3137 [Tilletia laevis]KAE8264113.1 hypothetical protein A4X03_0g1180 [Tilletia caries]KAE8205565.1 hypothetical protein CF335_g2260 [Tilletia laevis]CAD6885834.1 unnamed protein product [Tilletia caries]CAD6909849.1 unnamed protein product [Tilletia laevis]
MLASDVLAEPDVVRALALVLNKGSKNNIKMAGASTAAGSRAGKRKYFTFHMPRAWSYVPAPASASSAASYAPLPSTAAATANTGAHAHAHAHAHHDGDEDEDDMEEGEGRAIMASHMSDASTGWHGNDEHSNLGPLERTAAWSAYTTTQRLAVSLSFLLLGAAVLLSFNALISPTEYYRSRFRGTPYENTFSSWIVSAHTVSGIIFGAHAVATLGSDSSANKRKAREVEEGGPEESSQLSSAEKQLQIILRAVRRIFSAGLVIVLSLLVLALSTSLKQSEPPKSTAGSAEQVETPSSSYFYLVIAIDVLLAAAVAYLQNAVVAVCSSFGPRAMSLMLSGQGLIGVSISLVQLAAAWGQSDPAVQAQLAAAVAAAKKDPNLAVADPSTAAARIFFSTGAGLMALTLLSFWIFIRTRCWAEVFGTSSSVAGATNHRRRQQSSQAPPAGVLDPTAAADADELNSSTDLAKPITEDSSTLLLRWIGPHLSPETEASLARLWDVQAQTIVLSLTIAYLFVLTLALFPALTARVQSVGYTDRGSTTPARWQTPLVFSALHFVAFNFADLVGRSLPGLLPTVFLVRSTNLVVLLSASRTILLPLLRACNLPRSSAASSSSKAPAAPPPPSGSILRTDVAFMLIMLTMGISNGLLATSILIAGPSKVRAFGSPPANLQGADGNNNSRPPSKSATQAAQALSATVLSYWLTLGLAVGGALSFLVVKWA